jgi:hypothetical protein
MSAILRYDGPLPQVEVGGYGHFAPGEEKSVDDFTAAQFDCDPCRDEGWSVTFGGESRTRKSAESETTKPAVDLSARGPRHHASHNE